ncbi:general secretion pathway protein GspK [Luteolibacter sp. AS25]|uniref:general secretion pathway protein GspK n=1 Tax=Luteolibacter sp. AS25 TaxID=3135776 RepID=UPI00398B9359
MKVKPRTYGRGSALILVIFITALLGGIVVSTLFLIKSDIQKQRTQFYGVQVDALANQALSFGAHPQIMRDDPLLQYVSEDGFESYSVEITTEDAKLNINAVLARGDKALLRRLFEYWGMDTDAAQALADAMSDWVDEDDGEQLNGAERERYEQLGFTDRPYNRFFQSIPEMQLVLGMGDLAALKPDWQQYFTIYGDGLLDIYETSLDLLISGAEVEESQAIQFQTTVRGGDDILGTEDDVTFEKISQALGSLSISRKKPNYNTISGRFKSGSTTRRVHCVAKIAITEKEITTVIEQRNNGPVILFQEEKFRDTFSPTQK